MEIFKSCVYLEQMLSLILVKFIRVFDIYFSKEQINFQILGNFFYFFFINVWFLKKVLEDQFIQILRKYGVLKFKFDKSKYSKVGKEQYFVKVVSIKWFIIKLFIKDKVVFNSVSRIVLSEKKLIVKLKLLEKSKLDEKDLEKFFIKK